MCRTIPGFCVPILCLFIVLAGASCKKSETGAKANNQQKSADSSLAIKEPETVGRLHWLGKKRLESDTNAAFFLALWNLPESQKLEAQTLDKLALAPWRIGPTNSASPGKNSSKALFKELLTDLLREEVYAEVRNITNQPGEFVMAVRLEPSGAERWRTNLASALEEISPQQAQPATETGGWRLKMGENARYVELVREGDWTFVGLSSSQTNKSILELRGRVQKTHLPFEMPKTNFWLEVEADLRQISVALQLNWQLPADMPGFSVTTIGDGENVRSRGEIRALSEGTGDLERWNIPTNLIHDPLGSFTAMRDIQEWFPGAKSWRLPRVSSAPSQLFFWAQDGAPFQSYFAIPIGEQPSNSQKIFDVMSGEGNAWLTTNGIGKFVSLTNGTGVEWNGLQLITPFLQSAMTTDGTFLEGALAPDVSTNKSMPTELLQQMYSGDNVVYYDWELTGPRIEEWLYFGQLFRVALHKAQLPPESVALKWLRALEFKLTNCGTIIRRESPGRFSLVRKSSCGFTAVELHLIADWLESPQFPAGLHTFNAPPDLLVPKRRGAVTNAPGTNQSIKELNSNPK
jgi:hypothetical protein